MTYDYRSYLNTIISLLQNIQSLLTTFSSNFDILSAFIQTTFSNLFSFLPYFILFLVLFAASDFIMKIFFPRAGDK